MDQAFLEPDGTCWLHDAAIRTRTAEWTDLAAWARAWIDEWSSEQFGVASEFAHAMTCEPADWAMQALALLSEVAEPEQRAWVGSGPLEDLVSRSGHGELVLARVEECARTRPAFRAALSNVWLGDGVPDMVRHRLAALGARDFVAEHAMSQHELAAYAARRDAEGLGWG